MVATAFKQVLQPEVAKPNQFKKSEETVKRLFTSFHFNTARNSGLIVPQTSQRGQDAWAENIQILPNITVFKWQI